MARQKTAIHGGPWGGRRGRRTAFLTPQKATLGNRGCKTARRERPPTGHLPENRRYPELPKDISNFFYAIMAGY